MQNTKLKVAIEEYLEEGRVLGLASETLKNRRRFMKRLSDFLQEKPFAKETAKEFLNTFRKKGLKPLGINTLTKLTRAFVNFLARKRYIKESFSTELLLAKVPRPRFELIAPAVLERIIIAGTKLSRFDNGRVKDRRADNRLALRLMLRTGLRVSEVCNLEGKNLRPDDDPPSFSLISKGGNQDILPLPRDLIKKLRPLVKREKIFKVHDDCLNRALKRGAKMLGIKQRIYCHLLRHSFCTHLLRQGVPIPLVRRLMRHSSLKYTDSVYSHYVIEDLAQALNTQSVVRQALGSFDIFDLIERAVKTTGVEKDNRFKLAVERDEKKLSISVERV